MIILSLVAMTGLKKKLHNIFISAVAISLGRASCGPWASCFRYVFNPKSSKQSLEDKIHFFFSYYLSDYKAWHAVVFGALRLTGMFYVSATSCCSPSQYSQFPDSNSEEFIRYN